MAARLRSRGEKPTVIEYTVGRSSLAEVTSAISWLLRDPHQAVAVQVVGFDYFDEDELAGVSNLSTWSPRVHVTGLDSFAESLLPRASVVDVRSRVERAVAHLSSVTVVTAVVDGDTLDDLAFEAALQLAVTAGRGIVTVDLRHLPRLNPAQVLAVAEGSADLHRQGRSLMLVNTTSAVAGQLRRGGLSGTLRMNVDELI